MAFLTLVLKNLLRHKTRTVLAVVGISIGIATIVALSLVMENASQMIEDAFIKQGDYDFTVAKAGSADVIVSYIKEEQIDQVNNTEGIQDTAGLLIYMLPFNNNPYFFSFGIEKDKLELGGVNITEGRAYEDDAKDEVIIGKIASKNYDKDIDDIIKLNERDYKIVGIYETGTTFQDGGAMMPLEVAQELQDLENTVNLLFVKVADGHDAEAVAGNIEAGSDDELVSIIDIDDFDAIDQGVKIMDAITWMVGLLAIVIGGIGVMNTMVMSVSERTREIGVLRAVGWKKSRILLMILSETLLIAVIAIVIGALLGASGVRLLMISDIAEGIINPNYFEYYAYLKAIVVAVLVGVLGGLYPAWKASRLSPLEALRYE